MKTASFIKRLIIWIAVMVAPVEAGLDFANTLSEIHASADAKTVMAEFTFTNRSDKPVDIRKYDSGCSCMAVRIKGGKLHYEPGESGVLRADFDVGNFTGSVDKVVALWADADPEQSPSIKLTVRVHIPVLVLLEPRTLKWVVGAELKPQSIRITINHDKPVKVLDVKCSSVDFKTALTTLTEGREYELVVTPVNVSRPGLAILTIETDCSLETHRNQQAFAVVSKPNPRKPKSDS